MHNNKLFLSLLLALAVTLTGCRLDDFQDPVPVQAPVAPCNGDTEFCDRSYADMVFPTTHKAYNYEVGYTQFTFPNQTFMIHQQLKDGIRAMVLDVFQDGGNLVCYSGLALLGSESFSVSLDEMTGFMEENPREVVTLIIRTDAPATAIADAIVASGLDDYAYVPDPSATEWPTLGEMIETHGRLVIFTTNPVGAGNPEWLLYAWDHMSATADANSRSEFSCDADNGSNTHPLHMVHHHVVTQVFGVPTGIASADSAEVLNVWDVLMPRAMDCRDFYLGQPNYLVVDFYEKGDLMAVTDSLNQLGAPQ